MAQGIIQNINPALFYWDRVGPPKIGPGEGRHHTHEGQHAQGKKHVETVVGYAESSYCGTTTATILADGRTESRTTVPELICWKGWLDL